MAETFDQASVNTRSTKASFMAELVPGSMVYFKAYVRDSNDDQLRLKFPGTVSTHTPCMGLSCGQNFATCLCQLSVASGC